MTPENVEIIARLYDEHLSRPDRLLHPDILRFFDPAVEIRQHQSIPGTRGTFSGHAGLAASAREIMEEMADFHFVPQRLVDQGTRVLAIVNARGRGRASGVMVNRTAAHMWTLRDGRIVAWEILDADQALAAGLDE